MDYVERYSGMLRSKKQRFALVDGRLFVRKDRWISPFGPVGCAYKLSWDQRRELLSQLGGLWVMWTDGFEGAVSGSDWYAVICRKHQAVEEITDGKRRSELRRALRDCEVRKVNSCEIAGKGYETFCSAVLGYGSHDVPTPSEFSRRVMSDQPFEDIQHQWAVYCDGKMIAFAQNLVYGNIEVDYNLIKLHPQYLSRYSAYALIYKMNEYYLAQEGFQYVNDGFRSISHETGIQEFLIKKFGFEKAYTGLHVHYRPPLGQLIRLARPFRPAITRILPKANALFELDRLRFQ